MALVLDATIGGSASNSYVTLAAANSFFEGRYSDGGWSALSDANKERALVAATRLIDRLLFVADRATAIQRLEWPRLYVRKASRTYTETGDDLYYDNDELPQQLKDAVCELATMLAAGTYTETPGRKVQSWSSDDQSFTYASDGRAAGALPDAVIQLLSPFLRGNRLVRA